MPGQGRAEAMARKLESEAELRRRGVIDPRADAYASHEARTLSEHLQDFRRSLEAEDRTPRHVQMTLSRAGKVVALSGVRRISDLSLSSILDAVASLRSEGLGAETINHYIRAIKAFARWLWKDGRAREHTLAHLSTSNPESDRRRTRRSLTTEEAVRLIQAAESGRIVKGMTGPDRAMAYRVAIGTGFRADELRSLTRDSSRLDNTPPAIVCEAGYTKNGRTAAQPIAEVLANHLRPWVSSLSPGRPALNLPDKTAEMLRVDLKAAGIGYETSAGVVDFHALRATYVSQLVASGASVKACQVLARHATPSLTIGVYAKASLHDITGAVESLPNLSAVSAATEAMAATGTETGRALTARRRRIESGYDGQCHR